jgi:hypothetical protein
MNYYLLEELVEKDMIEQGYDPKSFSSVITYWARRLG